MKKTLALILLLGVLLGLTGCSATVKKEDFDSLQTQYADMEKSYGDLEAKYAELQSQFDTLTEEKAALEESLGAAGQPSETLETARERFSDIIPGTTIFESFPDSKTKILNINSSLTMAELGDDGIADSSEALGTEIALARFEDWFDYDYVYVDLFLHGLGRGYTLVLNCSDMSMLQHNWME